MSKVFTFADLNRATYTAVSDYDVDTLITYAADMMARRVAEYGCGWLVLTASGAYDEGPFPTEHEARENMLANGVNGYLVYFDGSIS